MITHQVEIIRSVAADDSEGSCLIALYPEVAPEIGLDGFIIQRMPEFEDILEPEERGASMDWTEGDEVILVCEVRISRNHLAIRSKYEIHEFDISRISNADYSGLMRVFRSMNFDSKFKLIGETG